jgi:hypothetical protein
MVEKEVIMTMAHSPLKVYNTNDVANEGVFQIDNDRFKGE